MKTTTEMQLIAIEKLIPYVNNARTHSAEQINKLRSSLREFGFINPVIIDRDFNVIAGHGRIEAAKAEGISEVPCVFADYLTEAQKKAYILADNRMAMDAGWDEELLRVKIEALQAESFDVGMTGFDESEIADLFETDSEVNDDDFDVDGELKKPPVTKSGDLWLLGNHRLLCGDSTREETYTLLMDGIANKSCPGGWLYARLGDLAAKVTAALGSPSEPKPAPDKKQFYRVRKTWADSKSQRGAFSVLANAKKCADSNKGYSVFDENGKKIYPADAPGTKKSIDAIAHEVIRGDWGNGDERKQKLTAAGYDYSAVQKKVNELLK